LDGKASLPWSLRLAYAAGQFPEGIKSAAFGFYLLFYYNQVLGLDARLASLAIFLALLIDAISDPVVGAWSDFTRSPLGRRHPWMYASAIPFALLFFGIFAPPDGLGQAGLFLWLLTFTAATRTAMTFYTVPYMSMGAELSADYDERTLLASLRNVFQLLGMFAVLIGGNMAFFAATEDYPNGQLNPDAYVRLGLAGAPLLVLGILVATIGTHRQIPRLHVPALGARFTWKGVVRDVVTAFRIPAFAALVVASIIFGITQGLVQALTLYTSTYFFELTTGQTSMLFGLAVTGVVTGSLLSQPVSRVIGEKRTTFAAGLAWYAVFTSSVIILELLDVFPADARALVPGLYITSAFVSALGLGVAIPMIGAMIADITDEHERRHGQRQEGMYFAAASFAGKIVGGAGPVIAGYVISWSGITPGADPASVPADVIDRFGWIQGPMVIVLSVLCIVAIGFYDLTRTRHRQILAEVEARRAAAGD
jgi:Na+/melibiose symporter-like transporter